MKYFAKVNDQEFIIEIGQDNQIVVNGDLFNINFQRMPKSGVTSLIINHRSLEAVVEEKDGSWQVLIHGEQYPVLVTDERMQRLSKARGSFAAPDGEAVVKSPMPGTIIAVPVEQGDVVTKGDKVVILESMKMENELSAPRDGIVTQVRVQAGTSVEKDQVLVVVSDQAH
jgi:propionyl-CoA carboxylase alpha chain/3-methylcrotonyl-CoA carboxylase alpha subunit